MPTSQHLYTWLKIIRVGVVLIDIKDAVMREPVYSSSFRWINVKLVRSDENDSLIGKGLVSHQHKENYLTWKECVTGTTPSIYFTATSWTAKSCYNLSIETHQVIHMWFTNSHRKPSSCKNLIREAGHTRKALKKVESIASILAPRD